MVKYRIIGTLESKKVLFLYNVVRMIIIQVYSW